VGLLRLERALPGRPHAGLAPRFQCHQPAQLRGERPAPSPARHVRQPARRLQRAAVRAGGRRRRGRGDPAPIGSLTWTASAVSIWDRLSRWASTALPPMTTRTALAAAAFAAPLALPPCGGGHPSISARDTSRRTSTSTTATSVPPSTTVPPATSPPASTTRPTSGLKAIEYAGLRFQVPQEWPVYDLGKDPTRCVRFDQHAVYLGHAGANQDCPAQLVGRTEAVQVEPIDATSQVTASAATTPGTTNGLAVHVDPSSAIARSLVAAFDDPRLVATVTFRQSDALAQQILQTFERAG